MLSEDEIRWIWIATEDGPGSDSHEGVAVEDLPLWVVNLRENGGFVEAGVEFRFHCKDTTEEAVKAFMTDLLGRIDAVLLDHQRAIETIRAAMEEDADNEEFDGE